MAFDGAKIQKVKKNVVELGFIIPRFNCSCIGTAVDDKGELHLLLDKW